MGEPTRCVRGDDNVRSEGYKRLYHGMKKKRKELIQTNLHDLVHRPPPSVPKGQVEGWCVGSKLCHISKGSLCKPCGFYWSPTGCRDREHCKHCHYWHGSLPPKPGEQTEVVSQVAYNEFVCVKDVQAGELPPIQLFNLDKQDYMINKNSWRNSQLRKLELTPKSESTPESDHTDEPIPDVNDSTYRDLYTSLSHLIKNEIQTMKQELMLAMIGDKTNIPYRSIDQGSEGEGRDTEYGQSRPGIYENAKYEGAGGIYSRLLYKPENVAGVSDLDFDELYI